MTERDMLMIKHKSVQSKCEKKTPKHKAKIDDKKGEEKLTRANNT